MPDLPPRTPVSSVDPDAPLERVRGVVVRVTYENPDNDYRVVKMVPDGPVAPERLDKRREVVLVGALPGIGVGETIEAEGRWGRHAQHGPQFRCDWFKPSLPTGARGIQAYLGSGVLDGVGEVLAARIVEVFGEKSLEVLDTEPQRLLEVRGISPKKHDRIVKSWAGARGDRALIVFLGEHGISPAWAARLRKTYGDAALSIVRANPYRLAAEVRGVGFARADAIARRLNVALDAPERIDAGLGHVLESAAEDGHTFLWRGGLVETAMRLLGVDLALVEERLAKMIEGNRLTPRELRGEPAVFLNSLFEAESGAAERLRTLAAAKRRSPRIDAPGALAEFERRARVTLAPAQREAVMSAVREGMMVLTGGPGTGKTTTLRAVIELFTAGGMTVKLAAPTGRAARRLAETSKRDAETIHRLLGLQPHTGQFAHDESEPVEADLVVIDETSMVDVVLFRSLLSAIGPGTCLLLVGDEDQLPSVGPGAVLHDVIASRVLPVVRLTEVFRQARSSLIVTNAHRVNRGEPPILTAPPDIPDPDFFFIERDDALGIVDTIRTLVTERIPRKFSLDPVRDIQVLTPMRRGDIGVHAINRALQAALNRPAGEGGSGRDARAPNAPLARDSSDLLGDESGDRDGGPGGAAPPPLRAGDRVMQTANDYEKEVFNGDVGRVTKIDAKSGEVFVDFEGRVVPYLADEARKLTLAYAVTIHKSQGSEYPAVVIPMHMQHFVMLKRNLLYTALTRGRRVVCVVGQKRALWKAVREAGGLARNSALAIFLGE